MKLSFKKARFNFFSVILALAAFAFAFRLANIATSNLPAADVGVVMSAGAGQAAPMVQTSQEQPPATAPNASLPQAEPPPTSPQGYNFSDSEIEVLKSLSKRREELDRRERRIEEQQALLDAAEKEVERKISELNALRAEIEDLLGKQQKEQDARIVSLVKIYEGMKPKEAATIFNTLDINVVISVIGRMNERRSSPILASMDPEKARLVTIRLMEQRKLPALPEN